jgi:hypothetical protein
MQLDDMFSSSCGSGPACPGAGPTDTERWIVQGPKVNPAEHPQLVVPSHEGLVEIDPEVIHAIRNWELMETVDELGAWIGNLYDGDALKVETRDRYLVDSDEADFQAWHRGDRGPDRAAKRGWLDWLAGHPFRNLHVLDSRRLTDYLRFELEWCYPDNVAAGAQTRILDRADVDLSPDLAQLTDFHVVGGQAAVVGYDRDGRFLHARQVERPGRLIAAADRLWNAAEDFTAWWARHPELHQRRAA